MRKNVREFVRVAASTLPFAEPILEIGSRPAAGQEEIADLHAFFPGLRYVGSDYLPGSNVDMLLDVHALGIASRSAGSIIMMDTLEHVQDPTVALRDVYRALSAGGIVIASSHMSFPIHNHPWDYWRYTPAAFDLIFQPFESRVIWSQGDPMAPRTVLAAACKGGTLEDKLAFDAATVALEQQWPKDAIEGPLLRFEPMLEQLTRDSDELAPVSAGLMAGETVEQTFVCPSDNLSRIYTKYATNGRMNFCHLNFQLREEGSNRVVAEQRYFAQHLVDNVWVPFTFPAVADSGGRSYRLVVTSWDGRSDAAVAPLLANELSTESEALLVNNERQERVLCFKTLALVQKYHPWNYRAIAQLENPAAAGDSGVSADAGLRQLAMVQSVQLSQVTERIDDRLDRQAARINALEQSISARLDSMMLELENIRSFVQGLRNNVVYKTVTKAGGLIRRRSGKQ